MRILFVTRKYPPSTGGMENAAFELYSALAKSADVKLIKFGGKNKLLPIVYPWLLVRALASGFIRRPDAIYLQDGIMGPLGWVLKLLLRRPTLITIHGLEVTYKNPIYRMIVPPFIKRQSQIVAVSKETLTEVNKGLPGSHAVVINNGVNDDFYNEASRLTNLEVISNETGIKLEDLKSSRLLHTNGRLVKRKGVEWFVRNVMPGLVKKNSKVLYLVSGAGKNHEAIEAAVKSKRLSKHVKLLGRISDECLTALHNTEDLFIMPNILVAGDMEGFGLVALEAASCGTTVLASKLQGIQDAITDGKNGFLIEPENAEAYVDKILAELKKPSLKSAEVRSYTLTNYSWKKTASEYERLLKKISR